MSPFSVNTKRGTSSQAVLISVAPMTFPAYQIPWSIATVLFFLYVRKQTAKTVQTASEITIAIVAGFLYLAIADTLDLTEELKEYSEQIQKRIFEFEKEIVMEETKGIEFIPLENFSCVQ